MTSEQTRSYIIALLVCKRMYGHFLPLPDMFPGHVKDTYLSAILDRLKWQKRSASDHYQVFLPE